MGVRDLIEVIRAEALNRLKEEDRRRRESIRIRMFIPKGRQSPTKKLERGRRLL
jgi:hypothetical protein